MTAFFNMQLPPLALSLGEIGLFLGMLLGVAVPLLVMAGFFV